MKLDWGAPLVHWLGGLLAYTTLAVLLYGIWRGTQHKAGRTTGPFAILRHPMYAGIILASFGSLLLYATWTTVFLACFSPLITLRARREEIALAAEFGEQWQKYCNHVPKWIPRLSRRQNR